MTHLVDATQAIRDQRALLKEMLRSIKSDPKVSQTLEETSPEGYASLWVALDFTGYDEIVRSLYQNEVLDQVVGALVDSKAMLVTHLDDLVSGILGDVEGAISKLKDISWFYPTSVIWIFAPDGLQVIQNREPREWEQGDPIPTWIAEFMPIWEAAQLEGRQAGRKVAAKG